MNRLLRATTGGVAVIICVLVFIVPFAFVILTAAKSQQEASLLEFSLPADWRLWQNLAEVIQMRDWVVLRAMANSTILTVVSVVLLVILSAMIGYLIQRRRGLLATIANVAVLIGLIMPPAIVPTVWLLQSMHLFKTMAGMVFIEVAFNLSFSVVLFRAFVASVPRELDEAALLDGAGPVRYFFTVVLPLLKPAVVTVTVIQIVHVFNDFTGPLYFLPGDDNVTAQLTLYTMQSEDFTSYNLLFANVLLITAVPFLLYVFFSRHIVAGMTSGAVK